MSSPVRLWRVGALVLAAAFGACERSGGDESTVDVDEATADVDEATADVDGATADVDGATADVDESTVDVDGATADVDESTVDVDGATADVDDAGPLLARGAPASVASCADAVFASAGELPGHLDEVSGVVADPRAPTRLWVLEDSGNEPEVYGVALDGTLHATVRVAGVSNRDWEDLAIGPCGATLCLYIADIGDNLARHANISVHRIGLPALDGETEADPVTMTAAWPSGARDAEALVVFPDETVVVLSKEPGLVRIAGAAFRAATAPVLLDDLGTLSLDPWRRGGLATAADYVNGWLLLRLYSDLIALAVGEDPTAIASASGVALPTERELQGEAVTWLPDGYATISEGDRRPIFVAQCDDGPP